MEEPYIPFYKPLGMSDEEYAHEIDIAHRKHEEWALGQQREALQQSVVVGSLPTEDIDFWFNIFNDRHPDEVAEILKSLRQ